MKYGKLENGVLAIAPSIIAIDGKVIYQPSHDTYMSNGYKPIVYNPYPEQAEECAYYTEKYVEEGAQIIQIWEEQEPPSIDDSEV